MKKIFAIVLALVMVFAMSATAFADTLTSEAESSASQDIMAMITTNANAKAVISVDVTFGDLTFVYVSPETTGLWNPETHAYDTTVAETGVWQVEGDNTITVTNHSNRDVTVTVEAALKDTVTNITANLDVNDPVTLAAGVENDPDNAAKAVWTLTLTNDEVPEGLSDTTEAIGTVTVTITPNLDSISG